MAYNTIHVNGPAIVQWGGTTLTRLGITEEGVTITLSHLTENVMSDLLGPGVPVEVQHFGKMATISGTLVQWEETVLDQVRGMIRARSGGATILADYGAMLFSGNQFGQCKIESSAVTPATSALELPYSFSVVVPMGDLPNTLGTRVSRVPFTWQAFPNFTSGLLYSRA